MSSLQILGNNEIGKDFAAVAGMSGKTKESKAKETTESFSKILQNLKEYRPADYDKETEQNGETTTITRVMSDGSVIITVMKGEQIVSQSRTCSPHPEEDAAMLSITATSAANLEELIK